MNHEITDPKFTETPQQLLGELVPQSTDPEHLQYVLDRSCTLHCVEAALELHDKRLSTFQHLDSYVQFLLANGPHPESGSQNDDLYNVDDGWYSAAVADLLRLNGYQVVLQQLLYSADETKIDLAKSSNRVQSDQEVERLNHLKRYGGERSSGWLNAVRDTLSRGGFVIASIKIPSSKTPGAMGRHSIVCMSVDESFVTYFDPDKLLVDRYGGSGGNQKITRVDDSKLLYSQPTDIFLQRMTGELMHVLLAPTEGDAE